MSDLDCPAPGSSADQLQETWRRQLIWWRAFFGVLVLATVVVLLLEHQRALPWELALVAGVVLAYVIWGSDGLGGYDSRAAVVYLVVAWALTLALMAVEGGGAGWILVVGLMCHTWASLSRNRAAVIVVLAVLAISAVRLWQGPRATGDLISIALSALLTIGASVTFGVFIDRVIQEANSRARIIDELHEAQAELAASERARGVAVERERISREIHDTLAQGFTSILALTRATSSALRRGDLDAVRERLRVIEETAAENLAEARVIVAETTPGHLESRTLSEALQRLVDSVARATGMSGRLVVDGEPLVLATSAEVVLLRTTQEALANVRRHSSADSFEVRLCYAEAGIVRLEVTDDGVGFDVRVPSSGYGLEGAVTRAAEIGGTVEVRSAPGEGARLRVEVPA